MNSLFWPMLGWLIAACAMGFAISAFFAGKLRLSRHIFLFPYIASVFLFTWAFIKFNGFDVGKALREQWVWGILVGLLASVFLVRNVRSQPASRKAQGADLALDILWPGFAYGITDALFLNVLPVWMIWAGLAGFGWAETGLGKLAIGFAALIASLLAAVSYHAGYPEFRGKKMRFAVLGNAVMTLAFLLSGSPLGALISHTVMHIAAVLHGPETTVQLPPHYLAEMKLS